MGGCGLPEADAGFSFAVGIKEDEEEMVNGEEKINLLVSKQAPLVSLVRICSEPFIQTPPSFPLLTALRFQNIPARFPLRLQGL